MLAQRIGIEYAFLIINQEVFMDIHGAKEVISILMGSPLYLTLPLEERHSLLENLKKNYPHLFKASGVSDKGKTIGPNSSCL